MAQNIGKRRGTSAIKAILEQERKAARLDPVGKKSFVDKTAMLAELASYGVPIATAANLSAKAAAKLLTKYKNYQKVQNTPSISLYRGEPGYKTFSQMRGNRKNNPELGKYFSSYKGMAKDYAETSAVGVGRGIRKSEFGALKETKVSPKEYKSLIKDAKKSYNRTHRAAAKSNEFVGTVPAEIRRRAKVIPKAAGGVVKKRAVSKRVKVTRGDGIAKRGKTRGRMV